MGAEALILGLGGVSGGAEGGAGVDSAGAFDVPFKRELNLEGHSRTAKPGFRVVAATKRYPRYASYTKALPKTGFDPLKAN